MSRRLAAALALLGATGCERILGLGEPTVGVDAAIDARGSVCDGTAVITRQFVIDSIDAPDNNATADAAAFDLDGDGNNDNAVFAALSAIVTLAPELEIQSTIDANLAGGQLLEVLQAELDGDCATTTLFHGEDRDMPPNPADNFSGQESFRVGPARGRMSGARSGGAVLAGGSGGTAELRLPLFTGTTPIELPLVEARVRYVVTSDGAMQGAIGGAIRADVVDGVVVPAFAASAQVVVARDCGGSPPDCCTDMTAGSVAMSIFDDDHDCVISETEVTQADLIRSLFSPDLDLYNGGVFEPDVDGVNDAVSIGLPFTAVNAFFLEPPP